MHMVSGLGNCLQLQFVLSNLHANKQTQTKTEKRKREKKRPSLNRISDFTLHSSGLKGVNGIVYLLKTTEKKLTMKKMKLS